MQRIQQAVNLFSKLYGRYKAKITLLIVLGFASGFIGGIGIGILIPIFSLVVKGNTVGDDLFSQTLIPMLERLHLKPELGELLTVLVGLFILKAIVVWTFGYIKALVVSDYTQQMQKELYRKTLKTKWPYLLRQKVGYLEHVITSDVGRATTLLKKFLSSIMALTNFVMYLVVAFSISSLITSLALAVGAIILMAVRPLIKKTKEYSKEGESLKKNIAHQINENIIGIKTIKSINAENSIADTGDRLFRRLRDLRLKFFFVGSATSEPIEPLSIIFIAVVFAVSYKSQPNFDFASFAVIMYLTQQIFTYVHRIQRTYHDVNKSIPYINRLIQFQDAATKNEEEDEGTEPFSMQDRLSFRNVSFSYKAKKSVLSDVSFDVKKGEVVSIIGASGSGKTTIIDLLLRMFPLEEGRILLDGKNISNIKLNEWRRKVGYVSQDVFLKNDTIRNNITFFDETITEKDIIHAAKIAHIAGVIGKLPKGYETVVGERGVYFSGGQRQRITLARVVARRPKILVLDEAMSAVDNQSELEIKKALEELRGEVTIIIISHRLSTVVDSDKVLVLENGRVVEQGIPTKLMEDANSRFYKMYVTSAEKG